MVVGRQSNGLISQIKNLAEEIEEKKQEIENLLQDLKQAEVDENSRPDEDFEDKIKLPGLKWLLGYSPLLEGIK